MVGTEAERQFYLQAAGIRMWYARGPLPGAAPSPDYDFAETALESAPIPVPESAEPPQVAAPTGRSREHMARLQTLMEGPQGPRNEPEMPAPDAEGSPAQAGQSVSEEALPEDVAPIAESSDIPRLVLQAWAGERFLLLSRLSEDASLALQQSLAENILRAVNETRPATLAKVHWPLFNNRNISLNSAAHLAEVVADQVQGHAEKTVIMLGETGGWLGTALGRQPDIQVSASLASLAGDPGLKRELWLQLKSSRARP